MRPAAVVGTGQTHHAAKRLDVSMAGLCREAIDRAMADAGVDWPDIDAVVLGKAPDLFEGVMMPELYLAEEEIPLPVARDRAVVGFGGAFADVHGVAELVAAALSAGLLEDWPVTSSLSNRSGSDCSAADSCPLVD